MTVLFTILIIPLTILTTQITNDYPDVHIDSVCKNRHHHPDVHSKQSMTILTFLVTILTTITMKILIIPYYVMMLRYYRITL